MVFNQLRIPKKNTTEVEMTIAFENEIAIEIKPGKSLLEHALEQGIPMAHLCKGNARCSTCRIVVIDGDLPPRNEKEQLLADKLSLPDEVRISCQLDAGQQMQIRRVIHDEIDQKILQKSNSAEERNLAILFSDIRSFTSFSERHLPYDIVHILNRYFLASGDAIHENKGRIDKYMGDGIMAIFGLEEGDHPAKLAYKAAVEMLENLAEFNTYLEKTFGEHFKIGIGIHYGPVVVGDLGHPEMNSFTAIGDTVNVAARIESATKGKANILVSQQVYDVLGEEGWKSHDMELKGKSKPLRLFASPA
jgi:adenylate cyclase